MIPLHVHSHYSLCEGLAAPRQLVARAVEHGMKALALTDTGGLYGVIPFYQAARDAGVRPLLGAQLGPCVVLARDRRGYADLCALVTAVHLGGGEGAQFPEPWPEAVDPSRLFLLCADPALLRRLVRRGLSPLAAVEHYGDAASHGRAGAMVALAKRLGVPAVAVAPVHFLDPSHHAAHRVLAAIRHNTLLDTLRPEDAAPPGAWFRSPRQLERLFALWPETLDNALWVAGECDVELELGRPLFPAFPLPPGETPESRLERLTFEGLRRRYPRVRRAAVRRARHELEIIARTGFAPYFLIVEELASFARSRDIPVVGRGSAGNSLVAHALGMTRCDPLRYGLYFERFLNPGRSDCPDIDLDFCWRRRDEVIAHVYEVYGADRTAMIGTFNTFRGRAAVRDVGRVFGFSGEELGRMTRLLPHVGAGDLRTALRTPECRALRLEEGPLRELLSVCDALDGCPRHMSVHAGGVVVAPDALTRHLALRRAAKGIVVTQGDMHAVEALGLVKMDLLGNRALSVLHDTVAAVRARRAPSFDIEAVPGNDPATAETLRTGRTLGCFQIESPAMRGLLRRVAAGDTNAVIQSIALVRPGASGSGMKQHFIDRRLGREAVAYEHPALEAVLGETHGVMIYQEDVLKVAHAVAGMDLAEADALRRAMGKKRGPHEMARHMRRFLEMAGENGVDGGQARHIWELIAQFASYAYCKAHAAAYGELAWQAAYLKTHFPAEFFAAVLANRGGFYAPAVYAEEAKRCGVPLLPPDINRSAAVCAAEGESVRAGLLEIKGLGRETVARLLAAREADGPFVSVGDFGTRVPAARDEREALSRAGAFDALDPAAEAPPLPCSVREPRGQGTLWGTGAPSPTRPRRSERGRAQDEREALEIFLRGHPLREAAPWLQDRCLTPSALLDRYAGRTVVLAGWPVAERRLAVRTGTDGCMKFISLDDGWGVCETVLFPEAYRRLGAALAAGGPWIVTGKVEAGDGNPVLVVEGLETARRR
ncbi:MAG TPA: DNA polymerase III subunit alpha [Candidatus Hydrogenedentes bacterium]|nr:DNA polymerase III subunit alpha [Candidatus Hydrogenedentota bacterium]